MGPPGRRKTCCICGIKSATNKSKGEIAKTWRTSNAYFKDFGGCFGVAAQERRGDLCQKCMNLVKLRYRINKTEFHHVLDSNFNRSSTVSTAINHHHHHDHGYFNTPPSCPSTLTTEHSFTNSLRSSQGVSPRKPLQPLQQRTTTPTVTLQSEDDDHPVTVSGQSQTSEGKASALSVSPGVETASKTNDQPCVPVNVANQLANSILILSPPTAPCTPQSKATSNRSDTADHHHHEQAKSPQTSPRKRIRDETPTTVRVIRQRISIQRQTTFTAAVEEIPGGPVPFLGRMLPANVMALILGYLPRHDLLFITLHFIIPNFQIEMKNIENQKKNMELQYSNIQTIPETGPLTRSQKLMLGKLINNRENNKDEDDCIIIPHVGSGGKAKRYFKVPKIQMNSKDVTKRTKNKRSKILEKMEKLVSSDQSGDGVHDQRVNNIARDKTGYAAAAEEAGLKIVTKFSKETVLSLRGVMTLRLWRVLKRVFSIEVGWDVFGSVDNMQAELKKVEFKYECGTVTASTGEVIHFVRVQDIKEVVTQMVNELRKAGELVYLENAETGHLWLHAAADKGGKSTKLILQVINQQSRHSMDLAKLIGFFEGKDNRVNMEAVFGPLLSQLQECAASITDLKLERPPMPEPIIPNLDQDDYTCDDKIPWKPLIPFDKTNTTRSSDCSYCKKSQSLQVDQGGDGTLDTRINNNVMPTPATEVSVHVEPSPNQSLSIVEPDSDLPSLPLLTTSCTPGTLGKSVPPPVPTSAAMRTPCQPHSVAAESVENDDLPATPSISRCTSALQLPCPIDMSTPCRIQPEDNQLRRSLFSEPISSPRTSQSPGATTTQTSSLATSTASAELTHQSAAECCKQTYTSCHLTVGGDWEGLAKIVGLSGPNGKFFCNHCLVTLDQTPKGVPHAVNILPKYQHHTNGDEHILPTGDQFLRTFEGCKEMNQMKEEVGEKAQARDFQSCANKPMLSGGHIIDILSTTPLHISLGLGLQYLNVAENGAIGLDTKLKEQEGQYDAFSATFEHKKEILVGCTQIKEKIDKVDDKIGQVVERKKKIITERAAFFKPDKRGRMNNTDLAKGVREQYKNLDKEKLALLKEKEKHEKQLATQEKKLDKVLAELDKVKGPFKARLDVVLDSMKLKRAAYHSGALIGPDVKKLVTTKNIRKIGKVFRPFKCANDVVVYDKELQGKVITMLTKFKQCYDLYTANRVLCRHEVELLALRCASLGCWFPVAFPGESLRRKFHLLTVDVPKQARRLRTVGMLTEQTIESIHPYINELERRFAKVADKKSRGLIICKQQNVYSQPNWNVVKRRGKGKRRKTK